ncbi:excinuclease ABC subunit UvrA [Acholeplasma vituli]|uniref:UvrABC system protein A n=1 Tax=Paracholeplasma vituli TaxID=69473 RepID=A0ABT2PWK3_9MOLU|nr:excinuclease ABC subunit UvrA [Paracholeplasma vituli]MCU0105339.1 excinuclease ABC subunit UvrA [Paracholeplasma vituli]
MSNNDYIVIKGAKENNLKNIDLTIPKNKLIVMTGLSGSGKSSLAFDTLYQDGQRRYVESLSSYARQFLGSFEKPNVDKIDGLSPAISIDQRTTSKNPRSTVGTVTEIYDYLRLMYSKIGIPYCPGTDIPLSKQTIEEMTNRVLDLGENTRVMVLSPVVKLQKGTHRKTLEQFVKDGFVRAIINNELVDLEPILDLDKNKKHDISLVIDRIVIKDDVRSRLYDAIELAANKSGGFVEVQIVGGEKLTFSETYACPDSDFTIPDLEPRLFSFNSPIGACPECNGLGKKLTVSEDLVVNFNRSLNDGGIVPYRNQDDENLQALELQIVCKHYNIDMDIPIKDIEREKLDIILYGSKDKIHFKLQSSSGRVHETVRIYEGVITNLSRRYIETSSTWIREWIESYMTEQVCPVCEGKRLNKAALSVKIDGLNIAELTDMSVEQILIRKERFKLTSQQQKIAESIINEVNARLTFLKDVGLEYLTLSREAASLSGGEAQRIRLATQIGSKLSGVLYVLDEPSIGLHQKDNQKLIDTLKKMRDLGNTLVVVEHDEETMMAADYLIDIGPGAGVHGGELVAAGTPQEVMDNPKSITGLYLSGKLKIDVPTERRSGNGKFITVQGASHNNLKNIDVSFPLGKLVCVTGVSGSGKSSLVNEILYKGIHRMLYKTKDEPGKHKAIIGVENVNRIIDISQSPIGRTPRSNPATYTGVFDDIRDVFSMTNEAKVRGYQKGRFSFNVKGGRCESCGGDGMKRITMHFLPDVYVQCEACGGTRYNRETLQVKYKGKNISEVLDMTIENALDFFENIPKIREKLQIIFDVGLGYMTLGQSATTLSGGEAQRVKLASELYRRITPETLYILDEPTTGLHTDDVKRLMSVINRIVDEGATCVIIEHNLDVIKSADYIIDLGKEGGSSGGNIVVTGTPEDIIQCEDSYTGAYLKPLLLGK